jgi:hypothetical protein
MSLALIGAGTVLGIFVLGVWGDVVIGAVVVGAARLVEAAARPVKRRLRAQRAPSGRVAAEPRRRAPLVRAGSSQR